MWIFTGTGKWTVLASSNKDVNEFEIVFDAETELRVSVGLSEGFKYDRPYGLSLGLSLKFVENCSITLKI